MDDTDDEDDPFGMHAVMPARAVTLRRRFSRGPMPPDKGYRWGSRGGVCVDRTKRRRRRHEFDADGVCYWCDEER